MSDLGAQSAPEFAPYLALTGADFPIAHDVKKGCNLLGRWRLISLPVTYQAPSGDARACSCFQVQGLQAAGRMETEDA